MTVDKVVGLTAGVDDYLVKPFDTAELIARVSLDAAAQQGVPRGLAADRAARQRPGPARDRRPDDGRHRLRGRLHRHRPVQERQRRVRLRPRRRVHHRAGPQPAPRGGRGRACRRSSSATSAATTSSFICTPDQVLPLTKRAVTDFEQSADQLYDPEDARPRLHRGARPARQQAARRPGHALDRGGRVDVHRPPVHRSPGGGRGRLRDEEGGQEPARLVRGDRPPPRRPGRRRATL